MSLSDTRPDSREPIAWRRVTRTVAENTITQQHKGDFRVFVAKKDLTIRLCADTMLQLKPQTKAHTEHMLSVYPYASTEISYSS
jgi:hypothetical protein